MKKRVFDIISIGYKGDLPSRFFDWFISAVIILNILAMTLSTFQTLEPAAPVFEFIEVATVAVFCIEYILRIWTADLLYPKLGPVTSRIRFFFSSNLGRKVHSDVKYDITKDTYLVFGREDKGLPESLLFANPDKCVRIPMRQTLRSLNLSNSVAVAAYEVLRQWDYVQLSTSGQLTEYKWEDSGEELPDG